MAKNACELDINIGALILREILKPELDTQIIEYLMTLLLPDSVEKRKKWPECRFILHTLCGNYLYLSKMRETEEISDMLEITKNRIAQITSDTILEAGTGI